jgi:glyoxylase-like metal-dependent hydrolase (beta-lactamase superfamily II)
MSPNSRDRLSDERVTDSKQEEPGSELPKRRAVVNTLIKMGGSNIAEVPTYEIYALRYASNVERLRNENLMSFDPHNEPMPMDFFVWFLKSDRQTFLVDTGFNEATAKARSRRLSCCPIEALSILGVDPAQITDVIITHMHWDHAGNIKKLPKAVFHLQDAEMEYATGRYMRQKALRQAYSAEDTVDLVRCLYEDRVVFHQGNQTLAPGVELLQIGGHTRGLQSLRVFTNRGWVVLASDATHYYDNMRLQNPFPIVFNVGDMVTGYETLMRNAESPDHIVPGHDPEVIRIYPRLPHRKVAIACLHLAPVRPASA